MFRRVVMRFRVLVPALSLGGCAEGIDGLAASVIALAGLFVALLFIVPPVQDYLARREHHRRMTDRSWLPEDAKRRRRGRKA